MLPEALTAEMIVESDRSVERNINCKVEIRGLSRDASWSQKGPIRLSIREVLTDSFFRDRPREPLTFRTTGCDPWRVLISE